MKKAIITGITGQDGAYLAELLLKNGYEVFGTYRRTSSVNLWRLDYLGITENPHLNLVEMDLTDQGNCIRTIDTVRPDEIYNLAAQSFVGVSFEQPVTTTQISGIGCVHLLEAIRLVDKNIRYYQAGTSEMFGKVQNVPQNETTPFYPRSPYGVAKLYAHWMTVNYRESYGIYACNGILFNHESPLRGSEFATRKITRAVAGIKAGKQDCLYLGNLNARRDWGFAGDYVKGMYQMLQQKTAEDFVLATGRTESVKNFTTMAFQYAGITLEFQGEGENEVGINIENGKIVVKIDSCYYRPAEVDMLVGDSSQALQKLDWKPTCTLENLCQMMVEADLLRVSKQRNY